jgi:(p)ppGpp synthase/HD superfamily hydrolase
VTVTQSTYPPNEMTDQNEVLTPVQLTTRFADAVAFAVRAHGDQPRKQTAIPYVAHLLGVASLVLEAGGDEDLAIAGLLHDTIEDTDTTREEIAAAFGDRVAEIVAACSDSFSKDNKLDWRVRKDLYLAHLVDPATQPEVLRVSAADKLHNLRAILCDYLAIRDGLWRRFKAGRDGQLWYYNELARIFAERLPGPLSDELSRTVRDLNAAVAG